MKITNSTRNTVLADSAVLADTPFKRIKGLLGCKEFKPGQALVLIPCNTIHTFFMHFSLDVVFIDRQNKVIKTISDFRPRHLSRIYFKAYAVIELPTGTLEVTSTQEGDTLLLQ